jgi:hypothetical protein
MWVPKKRLIWNSIPLKWLFIIYYYFLPDYKYQKAYLERNTKCCPFAYSSSSSSPWLGNALWQCRWSGPILCLMNSRLLPHLGSVCFVLSWWDICHFIQAGDYGIWSFYTDPRMMGRWKSTGGLTAFEFINTSYTSPV